MNGAVGAVVEGVHLEAIDDTGFAALHAALSEHSVVFLRDQHLTEEGHLALAERFGTPSVFPLARHLGATRAASVIEDTADSPPAPTAGTPT